MPRFPGTAGTADAMHIVFRHIRKIEVHNVGELLDIRRRTENESVRIQVGLIFEGLGTDRSHH